MTSGRPGIKGESAHRGSGRREVKVMTQSIKRILLAALTMFVLAVVVTVAAVALYPDGTSGAADFLQLAQLLLVLLTAVLLLVAGSAFVIRRSSKVS